MKKTIRIILYILVSVAAIGTGCFYASLHFQGQKEERIEESLAVKYLEDAENDTLETEETSESISESDYSYSYDYEDNDYFTIAGKLYTPDYAVGFLDCVLEIPSIELRRGVYTGTEDQIGLNLGMWMTCTAIPNYTLGKTHYVICSHNSLNQEQSFNRLKYVHVGDYFTLTQGKTVYFYDVTDFFAEYRPETARKYTNNFSIGRDKCYIYSCGRDEYRCRNIIVEGTLLKTFTLEEWKNEDTQKWLLDNYDTYKEATYKTREDGIQTHKETLKVAVTALNGSVRVSCKSSLGAPKSVLFRVYDEDGMETDIPDFQTDEDGIATVDLPDGTYVLCLIDDEYTALDNILTVSRTDVKVVEVQSEFVFEDIPEVIVFGGIAIIWLLVMGIIFLALRDKKKENNGKEEL